MNRANITDEKAIIGKESQVFYSVENKAADMPASSDGSYSNSNGRLSHKELSDEMLVRNFVEDQDEGAFNEIVNRYGDKI